MRNVVGPPIDPEDLFNQEAVINRIWERIEDQHIVLLAPRKFGKSSILLHLERKPREGWYTVLVDVSYMKSPEEFVGSLLGAMADKYSWVRKAWEGVRRVPRQIREYLEGIEGGVDIAGFGAKLAVALREAKESSWQETTDELLRRLDAQTGKNRLLILIDELGKMVELMGEEERGRTQALMNWFKSIRSGAPEHLENVRFIVSSSIGVDRLVHKVGVPDAMEDLFPVYIDALLEDRSLELFQRLADSYKVRSEEGVWKRAVELLGGGVPEFIQMFFSELRDAQQPLTVKILEEVYERNVLGPRWRRSFMEYINRFDRYGREIRNLLIHLLVNVAREDGASRGQLRRVYDGRRGKEADPVEFEELLADLESDFYLKSDNGSYTFYVKILKDWILRYYGGSDAG